MAWIKDVVKPSERKWEEFYRNRWQHDKVVRSTHGVNCTGSCSWNVYVKNGIVTWEMQATDYPSLKEGIPPYEPRGCQRGISFSWYLYSPLRIKYPYVRGKLLDLWRKARERHADPIAAWASIVEDPAARKSYQQARGKGGHRRAHWDDALEIMAAASLYTAKTHGPDRVIGFSPIPAMSQLSFAAGSRFLQLFGGVHLSFYDWYCDLPNASPEAWGEQTDVCESADWYNAKYIAVMGANLNMTRTPDVHFLAEARHNGTKVVVFAPDFSQVAKYADTWVPVHAGHDGAFWMAVNHVILQEFHVQRQVPYFVNYLKRFTDNPFLVTLRRTPEGWRADRMLRASDLAATRGVENADFRFFMLDAGGALKMPKGTVGARWAKEPGKWNLELKDVRDDSAIDPLLSVLDKRDDVLAVQFPDFAGAAMLSRGVPVKYVDTEAGRVPVATVFDLLLAQFGVGRGLAGDYPASYDDEKMYTPAWQEQYTGIDRALVLQFAREWAGTAEKTEGRCSVIIGAGINHWYHENLIYRSAMVALMLCGCVGRNGGGLQHYVGQEKLAQQAPWGAIAWAGDWQKPPRQMNGPSFHYVHSDQWKYDGGFADYDSLPQGSSMAGQHTMDIQVKAVRMGWLPFFPQFPENSLDVAKKAQGAGATTDEAIAKHVAERIRNRDLKFSVEDPDAPENWPRVWFIWRGNALLTSAKGQEYFQKHYLGTHTNTIAEEVARDRVSEVLWRNDTPTGKFDLVVDLNFRMDTSALLSDIVLPSATWYEKNDLNTTDMHTYIHPLQAAVSPNWESRSDWDIFKAIAKKVSELAKGYMPEPVKDVVMQPIEHDTPGEMAQPGIKDWAKGECEAIPGKTMPHVAVVERDYTRIYDKFISFGHNARNNGIGAHGTRFAIQDFYDEMLVTHPSVEWGGKKYVSLAQDVHAANVVMNLAPESNGELAYRAFQDLEKKVGLPLADLAEKNRGVRADFSTITAQPFRVLTSPIWSGIINEGRPYAAYTLNVERLVPWRTLTGRQHMYLDHEGYIAWGENLPTYKPRADVQLLGDLRKTAPDKGTLRLNYLSPHGKWHIHSTYSDNHRMKTLSRGAEPVWLNDKDAAEAGIADNDWVETINDNGVVVARAAVSARIPRGNLFHYHAVERTLATPKSPGRGDRRSGMTNSLTRVRLKPVLMMGGYGQFTYHMNYWGPVGVNRDTYVLVRRIDRPEW